MTVLEILDLKVYNNTVFEWAASFLAALFAYCALRILQEIVIKKIGAYVAQRHDGWVVAFLDALGKTKWFVVVLVSLYIGLRGLALPVAIENNLRIAAFAAFFIQFGLWCVALMDAWMKHYRERQLQNNPAALTTLGAVRLIAVGVVWLCVLLMILDNIGLDITALVAGLGVGGIAVALAVQNILGDLFASLSIVLDKTFMVGDFITMDAYMGTVENIGLKSTRIRSLSGEQIVLSNSDLLGSRIRNYGRMYERRVVVSIGVVYQTPRDKLKLIPGIIRSAIEAQEKTRFDRAHFASYGDSALIFEYVYYVLSADYNTYMDTNQAIHLILHERFEQEGIDFAYPTRTLFVHRADDPEPVAQSGSEKKARP